MMTLDVTASNYLGMVRENNEDAMWVSDRILYNDSMFTKVVLDKGERTLFAVADGVGGCNGGEIASEETARQFALHFYHLPSGLDEETFRIQCHQWIEQMHLRLKDIGHTHPNLLGMGTTLVTLTVYEGRVYLLNCGDSRCYRLRAGYLSQLTEDHSLDQITGRASDAHVLTNSIGAGDFAYFDIFDCTECVLNGDLFMLCSDGLSNMLDDDQIATLLNNGADSIKLVEEACLAGGKDNISVCLIRFTLN